jgi:hypothetical protein
MTPSSPAWVAVLCSIPLRYASGKTSVLDLFRQAAPDLEASELGGWITAELLSTPGLREAWQEYSYDKRGTPSPYLDGRRVGFVAVVGGRVEHQDVEVFETEIEACARFIAREAAWVLLAQTG